MIAEITLTRRRNTAATTLVLHQVTKYSRKSPRFGFDFQKKEIRIVSLDNLILIGETLKRLKVLI